MNNYQINKEERLKKANELYYRKTYNLDHDEHHDDYKRDRLIINKIMNRPFNLEILLIILKFKKSLELYEAMNVVFSDEDYDNMKNLRHLQHQQAELNKDFKKVFNERG